MDFALHSNNTVIPSAVDKDGPFDPDDAYECGDALPLIKQHESLCDCGNATACVSVYRRCRIRSLVYHSLLYSRRKSSNSYSVEYEDAQSCRSYGQISYFFNCQGHHFAIVKRHRRLRGFDDDFKSSGYFGLLKIPVNRFFSRVHRECNEWMSVPVSRILHHCIVIQSRDSLIFTPVSQCNEHD